MSDISTMKVTGAPGDEPASVELRVISAAALCATRVGLDQVMIDDIVRESGVARTTIYRRFGNRDAVLRAMIIHQMQPFAQQITRQCMGSGSLRDRLEAVLTISIASLSSYGWAASILDQGATRATLALFQAVHDENGEGALNVMLTSAERDQILRPGLSVGACMPWLIRQIVETAVAMRGDTARIGEAIRMFILPVLLPDEPQGEADCAIAQRLEGIETHLRAIDARLSPGD